MRQQRALVVLFRHTTARAEHLSAQHAATPGDCMRALSTHVHVDAELKKMRKADHQQRDHHHATSAAHSSSNASRDLLK